MAVELGEEMREARDNRSFAGLCSRIVGKEVAERGTGSKEIEKLRREFVCHWG